MNREQVMVRIEETLAGRMVASRDRSPKRSEIDVRPEDVSAITRLLCADLGARFQIASGVDTPQFIEILYHWAFDRLGWVLTVRTQLDREAPEIDSIAPVCVAAEWIEREMWELLGVHFRNHPDMRHLLLDDDWPEGQFPLRRDYER